MGYHEIPLKANCADYSLFQESQQMYKKENYSFCKKRSINLEY